MKRLLLSVVLVFVGAALWAQAITGNAAFDAKIKAESRKLKVGDFILIDEATETVLLLDENGPPFLPVGLLEFKVSTKFWPKNKLTENVVLPKFYDKDKVEAWFYMTNKLELTSFSALVGKCERTDFEKYIEELKAAGWNNDVELFWREDGFLMFEARNKSELNMRLSHDKTDNWVRIDIDSGEE